MDAKVTIEFNLPEQQESFNITSKSDAMHSFIWQFNQYLRSEIKYNNKSHLEEVKEKFWELLTENNISELF